MSTFVVNTSNWNSPAFWSAISTSGAGATLDFSALPSTYAVGNDTFFGVFVISDGSTTFSIKDSASGVSANATMGGGTLIEHFTTIIGTGGADDLSGSTAADTLLGGDGDDTLDAGDGADTVFGGGGNDSLVGGVGDDLIVVTAGNDTLEGGAGTTRCWAAPTATASMAGLTMT